MISPNLILFAFHYFYFFLEVARTRKIHTIIFEQCHGIVLVQIMIDLLKTINPYIY